MDFLEKLDYLMLQNNLNKSTLSKNCGIPYTTIDGWYKKGYEGLKLTTLRKLSEYFNLSLDFWNDNSMSGLSLNKEEELLIINYRNNPELHTAIKKLLDIQEKE